MNSRIPKFSESISLENMISIVDDLSESINTNVSLSRNWTYSRNITTEYLVAESIFTISFIPVLVRNFDEDVLDPHKRTHSKIKSKIGNLLSEYESIKSLGDSIKRIEKLNGKLIGFSENNKKYKCYISTGGSIGVIGKEAISKILKNPNFIYVLDGKELILNQFNIFTGTFDIYNGKRISNPPTGEEINSILNQLDYSMFILELKNLPRKGYFIKEIVDGKAILEECERIIIK